MVKASSKTKSPLRPANVFVVYQNADIVLAESLTGLLSAWGALPFHCRQEIFDQEKYRTELREKISSADLVVLILSREFRWSPYCQAEAGTTMALQKPFIPIVVHPVDEKEASQSIAQVLEGCQYIFSTDTDFVAKFRDLVQHKLSFENKGQIEVIRRLQSAVRTRSRLPLSNDGKSLRDAEDAKKRVEEALQESNHAYVRHRPPKQLISSWPSLVDSTCKESVVANLVASLSDNEKQVTKLVVIGVSLKYSLNLISEALERLSNSDRTGSLLEHTLEITLVHMHEESAILHALNDALDISAIRDSFRGGWKNIQAKWRRLAETSKVKIEDPVVRWIDYIPPRVGILIDQSLLYASHCKIKMAAAIPGQFQLLVGENQYEYFNILDGTDDARETARRQIEEFRQTLNALSQPSNNNGVTPVWESHDWLNHLHHYVTRCSSQDSIVFISSAAKKFEELIKFAAQTEAKVEVYVHDDSAKFTLVKATRQRFLNEVGGRAGNIKFRGFRRPPSFRAVLIGDAAIGIQPYITSVAQLTKNGSKKRQSPAIGKVPLCLIITECFPKFAKLKKSLLEFDA